MQDWGEAGGVLAGCVALLIAIGNGIRWAVGWNDRKESTRSAKLDAWQKELDLREVRLSQERAKFLEEVKDELEAVKLSNAQLHKEHAALLGGYQLIAAALRAIDPGNQALAMADELLKSAFPPDPLIPTDMVATVAKIRRSGETD